MAVEKHYLMGILNLTPDSFSDGGRYNDTSRAVEYAGTMLGQGADIIDVGAESTRPGSRRIPAGEQIKRISSVIQEIKDCHNDAEVSIDTTCSEVASVAIDQGSFLVNDISAGRDDPKMLSLVAESQVDICLMHMKGQPTTMHLSPAYGDVVKETLDFLKRRVDAALAAGIREHRIVLDPGMGFGKTTEHNFSLLNDLRKFTQLGFRVMLGCSRKRFIRAASPATGTMPDCRTAASCAATVVGMLAEVDIHRVHDVSEHRQVIDFMQALFANQDKRHP